MRTALRRLVVVGLLTTGLTAGLLPGRAVGAAATITQLGQAVTVGTHGNEPIIKVAPDGTMYISALEWLYVSTDHGISWKLSPGNLLLNSISNGGINKNTDSSIDTDPGGRLYLTFDTPYAGTTTTCYSDDRAQTLTCDPTTLPGGTDRMWVTAVDNQTSYLTTNEALYDTLFFSSADRGQSYHVQKHTNSLLNPNDGPLARRPATPEMYQPFVDNATNLTATTNELSGPLDVHVWDPSSSSPLPSSSLLTPLMAGAAINDAAFTADGTLYIASEDPNTNSAGTVTGKILQVIRSTDGGQHWTKLPPIPGTTTGTAAFAWLAAGSKGHVGVVYYYTAVGGRADTLQGTWDAKWAETVNADSANPTWSITTLDRGVHTGSMCTTAGCLGADRFAGDFLGATFDPQDHAQVTWMRNKPGSNPVVNEVRYAGVAAAATGAPSAPRTATTSAHDMLPPTSGGPEPVTGVLLVATGAALAGLVTTRLRSRSPSPPDR
ncbi:MAG: hypothetical protein ABR598_08790 [Candidatus Dormibacteria bacterium]